MSGIVMAAEVYLTNKAEGLDTRVRVSVGGWTDFTSLDETSLLNLAQEQIKKLLPQSNPDDWRLMSADEVRDFEER